MNRHIDIFISIVIPSYNGSEALRSTLESVLTQSHRNLEVLVVDDGSTEDVGGVISGLKDERLSYYSLPHTNANVARNYGIKEAKGDYIAMLDSDDLWLAEHIESCLDKIKESGADAIFGSLTVRNMASGSDNPVIIHGPREGETMMNYLLRTGYGAQTSTLFMTVASAKAVLWDETLLRHQDYDFVVRYSKRYRIAVKSEPTVIYRAYPKQSRIDLRSCMRVIEANAEDIEPSTYMNYHSSMLRLALGQGDQAIVEHYRREATSYKEYITFARFMQIWMPQSEEQLEALRREYIDYISEIEVELRGLH